VADNKSAGTIQPSYATALRELDQPFRLWFNTIIGDSRLRTVHLIFGSKLLLNKNL
jgi:hypothetical protein